MALAVIMPRQGQSVESCIITKWHKKPGDAVAVGDILFTYETDKATFDEESKAEGTLLEVFFEEGDDVPVLLAVCAIGKAGEDVSGLRPGGESAPMDAAPAAERAEEPSSAAASEPVSEAGTGPAADLRMSPRARGMAEKNHADLSFVKPSGPEGRVIARDVQALLDAGRVRTPAAQAAGISAVAGTGLGGRATLKDANAVREAPAAEAISEAPAAQSAEGRFEPHTNIRKAIARAMHASLSDMAQLTHNLSFDCTQIMALRKQFKEHGAAQGMEGITLGDMILYAVTRTLSMPEHRALNAHYLKEGMLYFDQVNLGVAVDTERGLMVPTIFGAGSMSLLEISGAVKELAGKCRGGSVSPDLLTGGTFTVSNLGALEIEDFTPVINPPQTGILGVNTITTRVRQTQDGLVGYPAMSLSLTYDHRALDGAPASRFLRDLKRSLENFTLLLARG